MFTGESIDENSVTPSLAGEILVDVEDVTKRYAQRVAVEKLTLKLRAGEVFGLVGANGGGKTTTLRMLAGILKPDTGHGHVLGFDLLSKAGKIRERVGYMSQRLSLYADLSVFENLRFRAQVYGSKRPRAAAEAAIDDFELTEYAGNAAGRLSGGWARRLQLAAALIHSPRLILLDEPSTGLDPVSRNAVPANGDGHTPLPEHRLEDASTASSSRIGPRGRTLSALRSRRTRARTLVEAVPGVIATYPQGPGLRVVADFLPLRSVASRASATPARPL